eukprot:gene19933-23849_t
MSLRDALKAKRVYLTPDSWYIHIPKFVHASKEVFEELWSLRDRFEPQYIKMFGKSILVPRRQGLFSERNMSYKFSGMLMHNEPATSHRFIENILDQVSSTRNAVFVNWYETGQDAVGLHSDNEKDSVPGSCIINVSLNATRTFGVKKKPNCDTNPFIVKLKDLSFYLTIQTYYGIDSMSRMFVIVVILQLLYKHTAEGSVGIKLKD